MSTSQAQNQGMSGAHDHKKNKRAILGNGSGIDSSNSYYPEIVIHIMHNTQHHTTQYIANQLLKKIFLLHVLSHADLLAVKKGQKCVECLTKGGTGVTLIAA